MDPGLLAPRPGPSLALSLPHSGGRQTEFRKEGSSLHQPRNAAREPAVPTPKGALLPSRPRRGPALCGSVALAGVPGMLCNMRAVWPALPACSPHGDGDATAAVTVPLVLTGPAPHHDVPVLQLLRSLCRQPGATSPAEGWGAAAMGPGRDPEAPTLLRALRQLRNTGFPTTGWGITWKRCK